MTYAKKVDELERILETQIIQVGLPEPEREYKFAHPVRKWRADFAWPKMRLLVEAEGGTWSRGRHVRGDGFEKDCEKYNWAAINGWTVLRYTSSMIRDGRAIAEIEKFIGGNAKI